jgi:hypothetical protein
LHAFCSLGAFDSHASRSSSCFAAVAGSLNCLPVAELEGVDMELDGEPDDIPLGPVALPLDDVDGVV